MFAVTCSILEPIPSRIRHFPKRAYCLTSLRQIALGYQTTNVSPKIDGRSILE